MRAPNAIRARAVAQDIHPVIILNLLGGHTLRDEEEEDDDEDALPRAIL
jgi:hypothetical protein